MKSIIVLVCVMTVAVAGQGKNGKQSNNPICSKELTVKPTDCCPDMPSFKQYFDKCATQCNQSSSADAAATEKRGRGKKSSGNKQFYKCVMPCVIQSAGILSADGNISSDLLSQQLLNGASSEWTPIVSTVVSSCFANATAKSQRKAGKDKRQSMTSQSKASDKLNGKIMKCIFKSMYLACPTPVDSNDCKDLNTKMSQCPCEYEGRDRAGKKAQKKEGRGKGKATNAPALEPEM